MDLSHTQMPEEHMKQLLKVTYNDVCLQSLHLCGNPGRSKAMIEWTRVAMKCGPKVETNHLKVPKSLSLPDQQSKNEMEQVRTIIGNKIVMKEKNMMNVTTHNPVNEVERFIVQRSLCIKGIIPSGARWRIIEEDTEKCYICDSQLLTIFFWNEKIGRLNTKKVGDPKIKDFF